MRIRQAVESDAKSILEIYDFYVRNTAITFEVSSPTEEQMRDRIRTYLKLGWLVYEVEGKVAGYAYASPHRSREAYQWCCEVSAYVDQAYHRKGIGRDLYIRLLEILRGRGFVHAYAGITLPNAASVRLHESHGFSQLAIYPQIGFKMGKWHDVGWWSLMLNSTLPNPSPPLIG